MLAEIAKDFCHFCVKHQIPVTAEYIPGKVLPESAELGACTLLTIRYLLFLIDEKVSTTGTVNERGTREWGKKNKN
ncbi:hypothetical protein NDU88_001295 [Pleurodeles waltl]|uniref:Uncharacterized protein n=1 Tax=Pleurodeles waltl TaxID=8319 RepID=A0AAV7ML41_PLEWA|nr:hypothetical protein NDU88_001295 [Pleurodeles waltl]